MAEVARADQYLNEHFQTGLLTDDDIQYDDEAAERGAGFTAWEIGEGPNAKTPWSSFPMFVTRLSRTIIHHTVSTVAVVLLQKMAKNWATPSVANDTIEQKLNDQRKYAEKNFVIELPTRPNGGP